MPAGQRGISHLTIFPYLDTRYLNTQHNKMNDFKPGIWHSYKYGYIIVLTIVIIALLLRAVEIIFGIQILPQ